MVLNIKSSFNKECKIIIQVYQSARAEVDCGKWLPKWSLMDNLINKAYTIIFQIGWFQPGFVFEIS